jgi:hypothetical protein
LCLAADSVYLMDTELSAQDILKTRHDKRPPMEHKSKLTTCVKVLGMVNGDRCLLGLHMRPNAQHGMVRWCRPALRTLHPLERGPASRISPNCSRLEYGYMSLCLKTYFWRTLQVGTISLCVHSQQLSQTSPANDSS